MEVGDRCIMAIQSRNIDAGPSLVANVQLKAKDDRGEFLGHCSMFTTTSAFGKDEWLRDAVGRW